MNDVRARVEDIRGRMDAAARRAGREPSDLTLVGASKRQALERLESAWDAGVRVFGENRVQEALEKQSNLPRAIDWHLIGPLQSNKARRAAEAFSTIHSIDRLKIARTLERHAAEVGRPLEGFLQVNVAGEPSKHGFTPEQIGPEVMGVEELAGLEHLRIVGLMAIPPFEPEIERARHWFRQLRDLRDKLFSTAGWSDRPGYLSMGMSHDFEIAIEEGATHVRVGSALFGSRPEAQ
jgi:pyridoxal phosphate enzyme (YggS family)